MATKELLNDLLKRGWTIGPDGSLAHPSRARLGTGERIEPDARRVEGQTTAKAGGASGLAKGNPIAHRRIRPVLGRAPEILITLIALLHHRIDTGNLETGFKGLQDAIAESLGVDDGDSRLEWEYGQMPSRKVGALVFIRRY